MTKRTEDGRSSRLEGQHEDVLCWVVLITRGLTVAFPPEIYVDAATATREAERWAGSLSEAEGRRVERPFRGRWEVGETWVRVVSATPPPPGTGDGDELWVGTHWTRDGYPEPEAVLFAGREDARRWTMSPPLGARPLRVHETPWTIAVTFAVPGGEADSEAHLAKVVS